MTEEQRKDRLRIGHEKDRTRTITKKMQEGKKRSSEDQKKQRLVTLKGLKQGDENELERKLRLEKVVNNHGDGTRRARLENDAASNRLSLPM